MRASTVTSGRVAWLTSADHTPLTALIEREFFGPASLETRKIHWSMR
jgi:hypothetical protein